MKQLEKVVFLDRRASSLCKVGHAPHGLGKPGILQNLDLVWETEQCLQINKGLLDWKHNTDADSLK